MNAERDYAAAKEQLARGDAAAARPLLEAAAAAGHAKACHRLGELLLEDGGAPARAAGLLRRAAEAGVARAQFRLGLLLARGGAGLAADRAQARRWCQAAADQGLAVAQFNLGLLLADEDPRRAGRWLRLAELGGVAEAGTCLDLVYDGERPRTWAEADTRASVALAPTGPEAPKGLRFADYYVDPCLDLVERQFRLARDQAEDVVQQFFCELEEPLAKGEHRGRAWKQSLRERYDPRQGRFRPYLSRVLGNFTRDWLRRRRPAAGGGAAGGAADPARLAEHHAEDWRALLAAFAADEGRDAPSRRALAVLDAVLAAGEGQAAVAQRLGLAVRTVRRDLHFANELLAEWLERRLAPALAAGGPAAAGLRGGLDLLPQWLHHPGPDKRLRALLLLALAWRALAAQGR